LMAVHGGSPGHLVRFRAALLLRCTIKAIALTSILFTADAQHCQGPADSAIVLQEK
jgi:hypothetical protein